MDIGDTVTFKHKGKEIIGQIIGISSKNGELRIEKIIDNKKRLIIKCVDPNYVQKYSDKNS